MMILTCAVMSILSDNVLMMLGQFSDIVSDLSPEIIRGFEHMAFTLLLN